ncbi:hypothetical protein ACIQ1D_13600 [Lysinibacillus xylanilyticus]|uniref:hypothetical protein n=1 Tax=Lysinibacillus xylanilyticus TaxID=582475 RepID=UPI00382E00C1
MFFARKRSANSAVAADVFCTESVATGTDVFCTESVATDTDVFCAKALRQQQMFGHPLKEVKQKEDNDVSKSILLSLCSTA